MRAHDWRRIREGDIVITAIMRSYAIGLVRSDGLAQDILATEPDCQKAIELACSICAKGKQVFLFWSPHSNKCRVVTVEKPGRLPRKWRKELAPTLDNPAA